MKGASGSIRLSTEICGNQYHGRDSRNCMGGPISPIGGGQPYLDVAAATGGRSGCERRV